MKNILVFLVFCLLISCAESKKVDTKAEGDKLMQLSREWSAAAASRDVEKTVSYWADDAVMISAGTPPLKGKAAIREMVAGAFQAPDFKISWEPREVKVSESGDMAYILEDSQMSYSDSLGNIVTEKNQAVSIWHKQPDGSWKNAVDISTPVELH